MIYIADTGFLVGLNDKNASVRAETRKLFSSIGRPVHTCEAVLTEASHLVSPRLISRMVCDGDLKPDFDLHAQINRVHWLIEKYAPRMDLADACIVRMAELFDNCCVLTSDKEDFEIYRRFGDKLIPCMFVGF